ncbi:hypothetical protein CJ030_MR7G017741 [Morella rubra]|uniref:Uncharacterized protein n=1 Tax=Morella rubra TaxID=262757 RepID=A0A6A1V6F7_9ROSI|nr:hypothetical protein CJ030_MR7G017741 [Morella rubra]
MENYLKMVRDRRPEGSLVRKEKKFELQDSKVKSGRAEGDDGASGVVGVGSVYGPLEPGCPSRRETVPAGARNKRRRECCIQDETRRRDEIK